MPEYDIASELAKLHSLSGAAYSKQVERIAQNGLFYPVEGEQCISIQGASSVSNRLSDSEGQSNHVLLNLSTKYNGGLLAVQIRDYFYHNPKAIEVLYSSGLTYNLHIFHDSIIQNLVVQ